MDKAEKKPENYKRIKELGKGACGKAYLVKCETSGGHAVIKQIDINSIKSRDEREKVYQVRKLIHKLCLSLNLHPSRPTYTMIPSLLTFSLRYLYF